MRLNSARTRAAGGQLSNALKAPPTNLYDCSHNNDTHNHETYHFNADHNDDDANDARNFHAEHSLANNAKDDDAQV